MRVLGIIPARAGSKRLPRKNVRLLGGRPLVLWAIEAARAARAIDRLVVSSDDEEVLELARACDPTLALQRPPELAGDTSPAIDYVRHALRSLEVDEGRFDAVTILQPSSPFTRAEDIDGTIALLRESGADSAVSIVELDHAIQEESHSSILSRPCQAGGEGAGVMRPERPLQGNLRIIELRMQSPHGLLDANPGIRHCDLNHRPLGIIHQLRRHHAPEGIAAMLHRVAQQLNQHVRHGVPRCQRCVVVSGSHQIGNGSRAGLDLWKGIDALQTHRATRL